MLAARKIAAVTLALMATASPGLAQDYGPFGYGSGSGFDWNGFYAGVYGGGVPFGATSLNAGIFSGVNVQIDSAVFGLEAQLGADFAATNSMDALLLGRGGMSMGEVLVYGTAGAGVVSGAAGYAFGGGAEYGFTNYMSGRVEVLGTGAWGAGPSDLRVAAGLAFHL